MGRTTKATQTLHLSFPQLYPTIPLTTHLITQAVSDLSRAIHALSTRHLPTKIRILSSSNKILAVYTKAYNSGVLDCPPPLHVLVLITPPLHDVVRRQSRSCHSPTPCHASASAVQPSASLASGREPQRPCQEPQDVPSSTRFPRFCRILEKLG